MLALSLIGTAIAYQRTEAYRVGLATPSDERFFEGFYNPERSGATPFRWTGARADLRLPNLWPSQPVRLSLRLSAPRPNTKAAVPAQVIVNNRLLATLDVGGAFTPYTFDLDADWLGASGNLYLILQSPTFAPPSDTRQLGLMVSQIEVTPIGQPPFAPSLPVMLTLAAIVALMYVWLCRLGVSTIAAFVVGLMLVVTFSGLLFAGRALIALYNARLLFLLIVAFVGGELTAWLGHYHANTRARRWTALLFFVAFAVRLVLAHTPGDEANFIAFKLMTAQITQHGIATIYELDPVIGAYPPVHHYNLAIAGWLYRTFVSPDFYVDSARLNFMLKMPTIVYDMLITLAVMVYAARQHDARLVLWAGAAYALNPGIIYTSAYNGQLGDPLYALFVTVAAIALMTQRASLLGVATALAMLTKPQASAFVPLLALGALRYLSPRARARAVVAGGMTIVSVLAPFMLAGTIPQMFNTLSTTIGHGPRIASNAFNLWWLYGWGQAWEIKDTELLFGIVSYRAIGLLSFFGVAYGLTAWKLWTTRSARAVALLAAFIGLAFFMLPTEIHENYLFPTFPLLALWVAHERRAWIAMGVLALTWFVNLVTTDPTLIEPLFAIWPAAENVLFPVQVTMALVNVAVLLVVAWWIVRAIGNRSNS